MRRVACVAAVSSLAFPAARAQELTLKEALANAAYYVAGFHRQLAGIAGEETYVQRRSTPGVNSGGANFGFERHLRSDLLLVRPRGADRYVELRDVYEVDGKPVRDRKERLVELLQEDSDRAATQMREIINASARYNVGRIQRNVNTPLLALLFLDQEYQGRFAFKRVLKSEPPVKPIGDQTIDDMPVFRVSTEAWIVEYEEKQRPTLVKSPSGRNVPASGRFWINPATGAVLISELILNGGGVASTITVSYQSEPLMGFMVPVEMRDAYVADRERVDGRAVYGRFRSIQQ